MTTIKFRRDTSANWTSVNPIPAQGEPCYETDTGKLKIGNGSDSYTTLPYVSDGGGSSGDLPIATATTLGGVKIGSNLSITEDGTLSATGGSAGTTDYTQLENKPQINSVELTGNKTLNDLGIQPKGNYQPAGDYATTADIPTKTSELTNDSGFLTEAPIPTNMVTTDTDQTISGSKTFTSNIVAKSAAKLQLNNANNDKTVKLSTASSGYLNVECTGTSLLEFINMYDSSNNMLDIAPTYIRARTSGGTKYEYINSQNIDTTYMKWDSNTGKLEVDTAAVAHLAMPSNTKVKLTLGASGTTYTAPADGYVCVGFFGNVGGNFEILAQVSNSVSYTTGAARCQCPVLKGDFSCWHNNVQNDSSFEFNFHYAVGTVPTNT